MKELSIEEKAKAYDHAMKVMEKYKDAKIMFTQDLKEEMFPELVESKDERIRKSLSAYFAKFKPNDMWDADFSFGDIVTWIEKQCEQKPTDEAKPKFKVGDKINMINREEEDYTILTITSINMDEKCYICNQGSVIEFDEEREWYKIEQKPADKVEPDILIEESYQQQADDLIDMVTEKPAWSEEDEKVLNGIIGYLCTHDSCELEGFDKWYDFLKSLKNRVQPQHKQEWSKEDKEVLKIMESCLHSHPGISLEEFNKCYSWLKSLRPQNRWKPSEEQMDVLLSEVSAWTKGCHKQIVLESLYNDLKKL